MALTRATDKIVGDSNGNLNLSGIVTASSFVGSGSGLTGVASTDHIKTSTNAVLSGIVTAGTLNVSGNATVTGNLGVGGVLTYEDVTNIDSIGIITARAGINVSGGVITGNGSGLTNLAVGLTTESMSPSGITTHLDLSKDDHKVTATGTVTIDVTGGSEADSHTLRIVNSGIATVGFSTYFLFPSGGTPNLPTASGAISLISFTVHRAGAVGVSTQLLSGASINFS